MATKDSTVNKNRCIILEAREDTYSEACQNKGWETLPIIHTPGTLVWPIISFYVGLRQVTAAESHCYYWGYVICLGYVENHLYRHCEKAA